MALFMDMHTMDGPVSADQVAGAHRADLETQGRYGVDYRQYWVDEEHGRIFAVSPAVSDSYAHGSRYSARRNTAPSSRSRSSADWSATDDRPWSRAVTRSDAPVSRSWSSAEPPIRLIVS